jgi:hypothetical protein
MKAMKIGGEFEYYSLIFLGAAIQTKKHEHNIPDIAGMNAPW